MDSQGDRIRGRITMADQSDPREELESRETFSDPQIGQLHAPEESEHKESRPYQDIPRPAKGDQNPKNPSIRKSLRRSILLLHRLEGYCRVSVSGIPRRRKLMTANANSLGWSRAYLGLARPRGHGLRLTRPQGYGIRVTQPQGRGLSLARPEGVGFASLDPEGAGSPSPDGGPYRPQPLRV